MAGKITLHARFRMKDPPTKPTSDPSANAFFRTAQQYYEAAVQLYKAKGRPADNTPVNFLFFHTLELALKAFLRSQGVRLTSARLRTHELERLYKECRASGLVLSNDDAAEIEAVVGMLTDANRHHAFRYAYPHNTLLPDLVWTADAVTRLMSAVKSPVENSPASSCPLGASTTVIFRPGIYPPAGNSPEQVPDSRPPSRPGSPPQIPETPSGSPGDAGSSVGCVKSRTPDSGTPA